MLEFIITRGEDRFISLGEEGADITLHLQAEL